ncbi:type II secretion system F family protein [Acidobacteriota bacterium]
MLFKRLRQSEERILFFHVLHMTYLTGADPHQSFRALAGDLCNPSFSNAARDLADAIEEGNTLSEAAQRHPEIFDPPLISMIKTGEMSGDLTEALEQAREMVARRETNRSRILSALIYPVSVLVLSLVPLTLITYIFSRQFDYLPEFRDAALIWGKQPSTTDLSILTILGSLVLALTILCLVIGVLWIVFKGKRSQNTDRLRLNLPVLGKLFRLEYAAQLSGILSRLVKQGASVPDALDTAAAGSDRPFMRQALAATASEVREGHDLSESLIPSPLYPPSFQWRLAVGERSGKLSEALEQAGRYYDRELQFLSERLMRLSEPVAIMVVGLVIILLVLVLIVPNMYYSLFGMINQL